jgi:hypothetical protein
MVLTSAVGASGRSLSYCFSALEAEGKWLMAAVCNENPMNAHSHMARRPAGLHCSPDPRAS